MHVYIAIPSENQPGFKTCTLSTKPVGGEWVEGRVLVPLQGAEQCMALHRHTGMTQRSLSPTICH